MVDKPKTTKKLFNALAGKKADKLVVSELLEEMMEVWGGPAAFCQTYHTEFMASKAGGMARTRMLDAVIRLFISHTASQKGVGGPGTGEVSDEELSQTLQAFIDTQTRQANGDVEQR